MLKLSPIIFLSTLLFAAPSMASDAATLYQSCAACHGSHGEGGIGPRLKGHPLSDITTKLHLYKEGHTVGPLSNLAIPVKEKLSENEITILAEHIAQFK